MVSKVCECGATFGYEPNPNYPDKRKYCDKCSAEKKASYEARQYKPDNLAKELVDFDKKVAKHLGVKEIADETGTFQSTVWNHSVAANSYEIGSAGNRFKLYFETVDELKIKINELKMARLLDEEIKETLHVG